MRNEPYRSRFFKLPLPMTVVIDRASSRRSNLELSLLPLLNFLQCLLDCAARFVFEFRIANQPLIEGFFRPEEVNDPSTTAQEEDGRSRFLGY